MAERNRVLVTGGGTFTGNHITAALLAEGVPVRLLVRPGAEDNLGHLRDEVEWMSASVWNPASLRGRARGVHTVIHTVGGMKSEPAQGLTYHYLNVLSLRNVADMCVTDGAPHIVLISTANALWIPRPYVRAKREAESYIARVGLRGTIIRAPLLYQRGQSRVTIYQMVSGIASISPFFRRSAPLPVDIFARGIARIAATPKPEKSIYYAADLKRLNTPEERRGQPATPPPIIPEPTANEDDTQPNAPIKD